MTKTVKTINMTVAGQNASLITSEDHYPLVLEALLKKVFKTVRTGEMEWPDAEAIYKQAKADAAREIGAAVPAITQPDYVEVLSARHQAVTKNTAVVCAKIAGGKVVVHNQTFSIKGAQNLAERVRTVRQLNLQYWR